MSINFNSALDVHPQALMLPEKRGEVGNGSELGYHLG